jgi:hypothetical protein
MRDSVDDLEMDLGRLPEIKPAAASSPSPAQQLRRALRGKHVCPFCGTQRETDVGPCLHCSLEDTPTTRSATRTKLGPWYVLQSRNPSAPGMNFATLMVLVQKGRVTARSVVRGPTTGQFWRHAAKVKGVSREFGLCWNCGGDVAKNARACPSCKRLQEPPLNPDVLLEAAEFNGEDLAEAMWADNVPASSQMPGTPNGGVNGGGMNGGGMNGGGNPAMPPRVPAGGAPQQQQQQHPQQVDRLMSRGGVRREIPPNQMYAREQGVGGLPPRPQRGMLGDVAEGLPGGDFDLGHQQPALEMAVFQPHFGGRRDGGGTLGKVVKSIGVGLVLATVVLFAWAAFDPNIRPKFQNAYERIKASISGTTGSGSGETGSAARGASGFTIDPPEAPTGAGASGRMDHRVAVGPPQTPASQQPPAVKKANPAPPNASAPAAGTPGGNKPAASPKDANQNAPGTLSVEQARLKVWEHWRAGQTAQARGDHAGAVRAWEAIKALPVPAEDLPEGLDVQIAEAKRRAK